MPHNESALLTLSDWALAYGQGASVRALLTARLHRIGATPALPNWLLRLDLPAIEARLQELEAQSLAAGNRPALLKQFPLWGVPFAVKDNIDVAGLATTAACPAWSHVATDSATAVRRLLAAGAVLIGKTNLDQFATGLVGTRSPFGAPSSTFSAEHISGGSSAGSAVVVSRGEVAFALGTDTAGSGRIPAGFNNIVGLKPTPGRVSTAGVLPACRSLDCVSVFALTVQDAAAVLAVLEGPDADDIYSRFSPGPSRLPAQLRVGIPQSPLLDAGQGYDSAWTQALARLQAQGAQVRELDFTPLLDVARLLYDGPWVAERLATVEALLQDQPQALDATVAAVIQRATAYSAVDTFRATYALRAARQKTAALWRDVDLLMVPTAPRHPRFDDVAADPIGANALLGTYTNFVNLLGWSALAMPSGFTAAGLPFGVTFIGPADTDAALAHWGQSWQAAAALHLGATHRTSAAPPSVSLAAATDAASAASPIGETDPPVLWPATQPTLPIAVVGAHLSGLPLNGQLLERGATLRQATHTAAHYRLYALPGTTPPKPGLQRVAQGGQALAVEVWDMPMTQVGSFLALIPQPLGLGTIELADGQRVHGFLCESVALVGARDITHFGGWRAFLAAT